MNGEISSYNTTLQGERRAICERLAKEIDQALPKAESKIWHGSPVWFIEGNPVVGYAVLKNDIQLLFWSGQSFDEPGLEPEGSFKAAQARFTEAAQINSDNLRRWLAKAQKIQWDYKNIVKRRGELVRLEPEA